MNLRENMGKASREKALNEFDIKVIVETIFKVV